MKAWEGGTQLNVIYYCMDYHKCEREHKCKSEEGILTTYEHFEDDENGGDYIERKKLFWVCPHLIMEGGLK